MCKNDSSSIDRGINREHFPTIDHDDEGEFRWTCACGQVGGTRYATVPEALSGYGRNHYARALTDDSGVLAERARIRREAKAFLRKHRMDTWTVFDDLLAAIDGGPTDA